MQIAITPAAMDSGRLAARPLAGLPVVASGVVTHKISFNIQGPRSDASPK